ncbi:hypothetical protein GCM10022205_34710 [Spinactinospora alkalitolerans]
MSAAVETSTRRARRSGAGRRAESVGGFMSIRYSVRGGARRARQSMGGYGDVRTPEMERFTAEARSADLEIAGGANGAHPAMKAFSKRW